MYERVNKYTCHIKIFSTCKVYVTCKIKIVFICIGSYFFIFLFITFTSNRKMGVRQEHVILQSICETHKFENHLNMKWKRKQLIDTNKMFHFTFNTNFISSMCFMWQVRICLPLYTYWMFGVTLKIFKFQALRKSNIIKTTVNKFWKFCASKKFKIYCILKKIIIMI